MSKLFKKIFLRETGEFADQLPINEEAELTCFVVEIINFEDLASRLELNILAEIINSFYSKTAAIIMHSGGMVDHFSERCITSFFGMQRKNSVPGRQVVVAAVSLLHTMRAEKFDLKVGIGICRGETFYGSFGSQERAAFTGIGPSVCCARHLAATTPNISLCERFERSIGEVFPPSDFVRCVKHQPLT
ncbi:MAG TPA: hypothetical protein VL754_20685 [Verrucomicrobiae bacterium]|nr:hypothetical protein [Verrucomicrobiae bacterium]